MRALWILLACVACAPTPNNAEVVVTVTAEVSAKAAPTEEAAEAPTDEAADAATDEAADVPTDEAAPAADAQPTDFDLSHQLVRRAVRLYKARLMRFFRQGFSCPGSAACMSFAAFDLDGNGVVTSYSLQPCGDKALDAAVAAHAASKVGQVVPPPPEHSPEWRQPSQSVAFACK